VAQGEELFQFVAQAKLARHLEGIVLGEVGEVDEGVPCVGHAEGLGPVLGLGRLEEIDVRLPVDAVVFPDLGLGERFAPAHLDVFELGLLLVALLAVDLEVGVAAHPDHVEDALARDGVLGVAKEAIAKQPPDHIDAG